VLEVVRIGKDMVRINVKNTRKRNRVMKLPGIELYDETRIVFPAKMLKNVMEKLV